MLRHARGRLEVASGRLPRCADARPRLRHRLRCEPPIGLRAGRAQRVGGCPTERRGARCRRRRRRRDRLRAGARGTRADPRVREDPGRLLVLVLVLRHPARPGSDAQPLGGSRARRDRATRRAGPPRDRPDGSQPRLLPRPRGRIRAAAAHPRGGLDPGRRAVAALVDRGEPPRPRPRRGAPRDADRVAPSARSAPVRGRRRAPRDATPLLVGAVPREARPAPRLQPDRRRHRRLPGRGRRGVRAHPRRGSRGRDHARSRVPVLASTRHRPPPRPTPCRSR